MPSLGLPTLPTFYPPITQGITPLLPMDSPIISPGNDPVLTLVASASAPSNGGMAGEYTHTLRSIADEHGLTKDKVKYAFRKVTPQLGQVIEGVRKFTDAERVTIESELGIDLVAKRVASALSVVVEPVNDVLSTYNPVQFSAITRQYKAADDSVQIEQGNQALVLLMQQSTADDNAATAALVQQAQNRGRKLGAMLAQVEIGTAMQEKQTVKNAFFEANGVVEKAEN